MKKLLYLLIAGLTAVISCTEGEPRNTKNDTTKNQITMEKDKIYVTALIYIKEGQAANFERYRARAGAILEKHNARLERVIRPTFMAQGEMPLPSEIHFAVFNSKESMEALNADTEYQEIIEKYRNPSVENLIVIPSQLSDFEFVREVGDKSKFYGVALMNYNEGAAYKEMFEDYHEDVCAIMPEFGAHFERFLIPTAVKGDFKQPDEIHRFYFDSMDGLQQMGSDPRMTELFPQRERSLGDLNFMIGEAL